MNLTLLKQELLGIIMKKFKVFSTNNLNFFSSIN